MEAVVCRIQVIFAHKYPAVGVMQTKGMDLVEESSETVTVFTQGKGFHFMF